jgi:heat shock protein HtpX
LVFVIIVGYIFSLAMDNSTILYIAVGFSFLMNIFSYYNSDKLVLAISGAKEVKREVSGQSKELYRIVENLCITAGLPVPKIYIINDPSPNAFATGRNPEHAVVAVTSGLLSKLEKNELEGVIAHELSHIGNRDILLATMVTVLVGLIVLLADWFRRWAFFSRGGDNNKGQLQIIIMIVAIILSIIAPVFAYIMQFAISRKREFSADADGALLTRYPEGLASALEKIANDPNPIKRQNRATAHLFISSPVKEKNKPGFFKKAFMTHPPVEERIKRLRESV